jgi:N6-adenosine-specific RNA methylase IME4
MSMITTPIFRTITADPPWNYRDRVGPGLGMGADRIRGRRGAAGYYDLMSLEQIVALGAGGTVAGFQASQNAHLYLWTTNAFMEQAHVVARAWGFLPRTVLTWVKPQIGMGHFFRNTTEHVVFAVRGSLPLHVKNQRTDFTAPRGRHSEKPEAFFEIVERCSPGPYLELFARKARPGWTAWGNEVTAEVEVA